MTENSKIEWTDHTFNPWIGCTKVSPGCDHCYAEGVAERFKMAEWGAGKPRKLTSNSNWQQPIAWNKRAGESGVRERVFCASLADVFDNEAPEEWRVRLWNLIYETPNLDWLVLTKRIGNARHMLPLGAFREEPLKNLWLGISVVNQAEADRDIPKLLGLPIRIKFLSMEPLLGPVNLAPIASKSYQLLSKFYGDKGFDESGSQPEAMRMQGSFPKIDWVIVGGESGTDARPMHPHWAQSLRDQCRAAGVPFFFKQWGEWQPAMMGHAYMEKFKEVRIITPDGLPPNRNGWPVYLVGKKAAGRELDGQKYSEFPMAKS